MLRVVSRLLRKKYQPLNKIIIQKDSLISNYRYLSKLKKGVKIAPVLKSNAYEHGIVEVAKTLDLLGTPFFCVDSVYEAYQLLKAKIKTPILIMGYVEPSNLRGKKLPFQYAVWDLETAKGLAKYQEGAQIHIFVDTGMGREGIAASELEGFLKQVKQLDNLTIVGFMSHFASADEKGDPQTKLQEKEFEKALKIFKKLKVSPKYIHISNSAGLFNASNKFCNVARVGKALYGIDPQDAYNPKLKPVLRMVTRLVQIKTVKKGSLVGYGGEFKAIKDTVLGILPLGYNDGLDRRLSNKGQVMINDKFCRIIGKISMNVTAVDLTGIKDPKVGDEVLVISDNQTDPNSVLNIAKLSGTIPHDVLVNLASTTKRVVS